MNQRTFNWFALGLSLSMAACEDPAAEKTQAAVSSAKPTASTAAEGATSYTIASDSKVDFVGSKVTGKHEGGFKKVTGTAKVVGDALEGGSVEAEIDTTSVYTDADGLTKHLKGDEFFNIEKFPTAKFVSTEIKKGGADGATHTVTGNLTLRGETKSITFPATIAKADDGISVKAEFSINRKDFGIMYAGKEDDLIRDGVVIKLALKLQKG